MTLRPRNPSTLKRRITTLALWLCIGALLNITIAWALTLIPFRWDYLNYVWVPATQWPHTCPADWPPPRRNAEGRSWTITTYRYVAHDHGLENADGTIHGWVDFSPDYRSGPSIRGHRIGFPFRSLCAWGTYDDRKQIPALTTSRGSLKLKLPWRGTHWLPYVPLWPGFLANTALYALLAWSLTRAPSLLRRLKRNRQGHCPHCNYNLTGLPPTAPCPECGSRLPVRRTELK